MVPGYAFTQQNGWLLIILPWCEIIHGSLAKTRRQEVLHCNHFLIILFALGAACQVKDGEFPRLTPLAPKIEHLFPLRMTGAKHRDRFGPVQVLSYFFKIACFFTRLPHLSSLSSLPNCVLIRCLCLSRSHRLSLTGDLRTPRKLNRNWQDCSCDHLQPRNPSHQLDFGRCWRQT